MGRIHGRQGGLAAVEFAIALPLIILIALAVVELGRGLYQFNTLSKAVHDGARFLADDIFIGHSGSSLPAILATDTDLVAATKNLVVSGDVDGGPPVLEGLTTSSVTITSEFVDLSDIGTDDNHIKVSASFTFVPLFPTLSALGYSMVPTFTASAVERALKI